ncbi:MAG: BMP family ABC transporter substrate-binding protein, partial [Mesorhizobium sp.]
WNIEPVYAAMIADIKADTFGTKHYSIGLQDDSVKLLKTAAIPDKVWSEIQAVRDDVISGKIKVDPVYDAAAVRALMTSVAQ